MDTRHCRYCGQQFLPSRSHPQQAVCCQPACQQRRRADNRKQKLLADPEYRQVCRDSARKWRAEHPDYWRNYRATHPQSVERNRTSQQQRDQCQRLLDLANNNWALDLKSLVAGVWLLGPAAQDLANNNLAAAQVFILQSPLRKPPQICAGPRPAASPARHAGRRFHRERRRLRARRCEWAGTWAVRALFHFPPKYGLLS